ncbi:uncharacterized protein LOC118194792 [Stegodyphus dumicola]|uniref:uncharacterized protein LOC118194792 n=1 Tax=Stegodyphus dumicola TaxID=202533 RepID=UPI0015AB7CDE|nr:uncharacterized protein LOC118194792 [Stegodyphus dumicola]
MKRCSITSARYTTMLQNYVAPELQHRNVVNDFVWMQDGSPPHVTTSVRQAPQQQFGDGVMSSEEDKIRDAECIDSLVCAELPDATRHPELHNIVKSSMIHGPCGELNRNSPCMSDGVCSKGFPKPFQAETKENVNGYPLYRRRDDGNFIVIKGHAIDNRWVVPYNPYLSKKYNAHINVEVCSSIKSVKYLFKYVYKGHDAAKVVLEESGDRTLMWDEIKCFLNARYVSAPEAAWRLYVWK